MSSAFSVGFLLGPAAGGVLATLPAHRRLRPGGMRVPFLVAAGLCAVNWVYGLFVLPESLPPERRIAGVRLAAAPTRSASLELLRSHRDLLPLAAINFLFQLAQQVLPNIFVLYTQLRYHWSLELPGRDLLSSPARSASWCRSFVVGPVVRRDRRARGGDRWRGLRASVGFIIYALAPDRADLLHRHADLRPDRG